MQKHGVLSFRAIFKLKWINDNRRWFFPEKTNLAVITYKRVFTFKISRWVINTNSIKATV